MLGETLLAACSVISLACADTLTLIALVVAVILIIICTRGFRGLKGNEKMGAAYWDPKGSWASTLTATGAILGSVLSAPAVLPANTLLLSRAHYFGLSLFFGALTVVAPFGYNTVRCAEKTDGGKRLEYHGYVWSFLTATALLLWAVLGQLATLSLLLNEPQSHDAMPGFVRWAFQLVLLLAAIGLIPYTRQSIRLAVENRDLQPAQKVREMREALGIAERDVRPRWSIL
jgi:hypothetical protein